MLTTLERGVKGGRWFSLIDKVASRRVLKAAFRRVKRNNGSPGVDRVTIRQFESNLEQELTKLSRSLLAGSYRPQELLRKWIPKPSGGRRALGIPTVRDRVAQGALRSVLEPIYEREFASHSYGFRPGRGCRDALRHVQSLLDQGYTWVVDADFRSFFDTLRHDVLLALVARKVSDGRVLSLLEDLLQQRILEGLKGWTPSAGTPQGAVISPLLANIYLDPLDHLLAELGFQLARYADDLVILCRSQSEARAALAMLEDWASQAGLSLHRDKTRLVDATQAGGFDFLGYHFEQGRRWPRKKSLERLKGRIRQLTKRNNGHSLSRIIADLNPILRGWFEYFKHSHRFTFERLDRWIRVRLRSILRRRIRLRGRGRGQDHVRWPNRFFAEHGLLSLKAAHAQACQSCRR
ncbi:MAG: group II intron reverse transcriptase/maturase [bacterium]|nr:group II intron reverse transcriptase/maturase [bacterium]